MGEGKTNSEYDLVKRSEAVFRALLQSVGKGNNFSIQSLKRDFNMNVSSSEINYLIDKRLLEQGQIKRDEQSGKSEFTFNVL